MGHYHTVIDYLIKKPNTIVKIACLREDPSVILGYSVYNENALHWVFCKRNWRNIGIAKDLVPSNLNTATHYTKVGRSIMYRKQWIFNPFIL